jgi:hypothetical protein
MKLRVAIVTAALSALCVGQTKTYTPPKTPWGEPDIQGNWPAQFNIPRERPADAKGSAVLSDEEVAQRQAQTSKQFATRQQQQQANPNARVGIGPPGNWGEIGRPNKQTSLVVDPPDGKMPALTPQARAILQSERGGLGPGQHFPDKVDTPEDFDFYSRCISRGFPSTMLYTLYNYGNDIYQSPGYVVIRAEMVHEQRIIPTSAKTAHIGKDIKTYMGNSIGHWEGNTLVVETTNLRPESGFGARYTDAAKVTERITRTAHDQLLWEATLSDPNVWTRQFTLRYPFKLDPEYKVYEYACHEGNYMMLDSLKGARVLESEGKETKVNR